MSSLLSQRDKDLVSNYLLGGAATGGGLALATALVNYLKHLKDEQSSDQDDDTIRIYKEKPQEKVAMTLGGPLALAGGVVSAAGTYALVNKLYEMYRKKKAQEELDAAQDIFLGIQGYKKLKDKEDSEEESSEEKSASIKQAGDGKGMSASELGISIPLALPLLMALGSGVVAHKMLNKSFPIKKKTVQAPKRIEIVDAPAEETKTEEDLLKDAGVTDNDGYELLVRTISMSKSATSDIKNMLATIGDGRLKDFKKAASMLGFDGALDTIKGASANISMEPLREQLAISCLTKSASVGEQSKLLAAAEFADIYPNFFKMAASLNEVKQEALYKIACLFGHAIRSEIAEQAGVTPGKLTKKAELGGSVLEEMMDTPDSENDSNQSTETSQEEAGVKKKRKFVYNSKKGFSLAKKLQDDDIIDKILSPSK